MRIALALLYMGWCGTLAGCSTVSASIPLPDGTMAQVKATRFLTTSDVTLTDQKSGYTLVYGQRPQETALLDTLQKLLPLLTTVAAPAAAGALR